jgi:hypothetical protein
MLAHAGMREIRRVIELSVGTEAMSSWSDINLASQETVHPVVENLRDVLVSLKQRGNVKIALSTSDLEGNAKSVLDLLGISDLFDIVVCRFLPFIPLSSNSLSKRKLVLSFSPLHFIGWMRFCPHSCQTRS